MSIPSWTDPWRITAEIQRLQLLIDGLRHDLDMGPGRDMPEWVKRNAEERIRRWTLEIAELRLRYLELL